LTKTRKRRRAVNETIFSGNLLLDFISPLFVGNFNILAGANNLGQLGVLNSFSSNFLNRSKSNQLVYITHSKKEALRLSEFFQQRGYTNFAIFTLSDAPGETEFYYLPRAAMNYIQNLIESHKSGNINQSNEKMNILICYDDIMTYILKEKNIFQTAKCHMASTNIFADIREQCGNFGSQNAEYSVTSVMIADKNKANFEFEGEYEKSLSNIFSFTDKIVKFETSIKMLRSKSKIIF
jgi:hypothetical protein